MRLPLLVLFTLSSLCLVRVHAQDSKAPSLSNILLTSGKSLIGEVRSESTDAVVVTELATGEEVTFKPAEIKSKYAASETIAIARVGLARFLAWRVKRELSVPASGKVAEVAEAGIYINLGSKDGVEVGQTYSIVRDDGELKDPDTGKVIGVKKTKLAKVEVVEVQERFSKTKRVGNVESEPKAGDRVEREGGNQAVAVLPILDPAGNQTAVGKALSEEIYTLLVKRGVTVVERDRLSSVLAELSLQQSKAFDANTVQKVGKHLGAATVLTGSVIPKGKSAEAHVRLIRVQTGEAIMAASQVIADAGNTATPVQPAPKSDTDGKEGKAINQVVRFDNEKAAKEVWDFDKANKWQLAKTGGTFTDGQITSNSQINGDFTLTLQITHRDDGVARVIPPPTVIVCGESIPLCGGHENFSGVIRLARKGENLIFARASEKPREIKIKEENQKSPTTVTITYRATTLWVAGASLKASDARPADTLRLDSK